MPSPKDRGANMKTLHSSVRAKAEHSDAHSPIVASIADVQPSPCNSDNGLVWPGPDTAQASIGPARNCHAQDLVNSPSKHPSLR